MTPVTDNNICRGSIVKVRAPENCRKRDWISLMSEWHGKEMTVTTTHGYFCAVKENTYLWEYADLELPEKPKYWVGQTVKVIRKTDKVFWADGMDKYIGGTVTLRRTLKDTYLWDTEEDWAFHEECFEPLPTIEPIETAEGKTYYLGIGGEIEYINQPGVIWYIVGKTAKDTFIIANHTSSVEALSSNKSHYKVIREANSDYVLEPGDKAMVVGRMEPRPYQSIVTIKEIKGLDVFVEESPKSFNLFRLLKIINSTNSKNGKSITSTNQQPTITILSGLSATISIGSPDRGISLRSSGKEISLGR